MLKAIAKISSWEIETIDDQVRDSRRLNYLPDVLRGSPHLANTSAERNLEDAKWHLGKTRVAADLGKPAAGDAHMGDVRHHN